MVEGRARVASPDRARAAAVAAGAWAGGSHVLLCLLIQVESFVTVVLPDQGRAPVVARFLAATPWMQLEHLVVAGALAVAVFSLWPTGVGKLAAVILVTLMNAYLALDQVTFGVLASHLHPGLSEEWPPSLRLLLDSLLAEAGLAALFNATLVLASTAVLLGPSWCGRLGGGLAARGRRLWQGAFGRRAILGYVAVSVLAWLLLSNDRLEIHPLLALLRPSSSVALTAASGLAESDLYRTRAPLAAEPAAEGEELAAAGAALRRSRPNVVLLVLESIAAPQLLEDGMPRADRAPVVSRLAEDAVVFDQIYTVAPFTLPSHLFLHTGGDAITADRGATPLSPFAGSTLAREFHAAGYRTAFMTGGDLAYADTLAHIEAAGYDTILHAGSLPESVRRDRALNSWGVDDALVFERAEEWVRAAASAHEPFFLQILTLATHHPFSLPAGVDGAESRLPVQRYYAGLRYTDALFGGLVEAMRQQGLLEQTVFVVTGDHGQAFSEVHLGRAGHGRVLYDESVRTFLIVAAPGRLSGTRVSHRLGTFADVLPTLAPLAGRRASWHGQDLFAAERQQRIAYFYTLKAPLRVGLRDGRWKFMSGLVPGDRCELYDLAADPKELRNVAAAHPDLVETYGALCRTWWATATQQYLADAGTAPRAAVAARDAAGVEGDVGVP